MKKLFYLALALLFCFSINAQTTPAGENISLDQQLSAVNKSTVTSGIIYERAVQIANLYNFNKSIKFNTANYPYFKQALLEMNKASNGTKFITVDALKNLVAPTIVPNEVDMAILNTQFQVLNYNEDKPSAGGLTYNATTNKFAPIVGKVPFYTMNTTVIAPTKETVSGTAITYKIRPDLFFQNGTKTIKTLTANFGDGIVRTLITNYVLTPQNIVVNYTSTGIKTSVFNITYADNSIMTTYGSLFLKYQNNALSKTQNSSCMGTDLFKEDLLISADEAFSNYDNSQRFKAQIEARIFYHNGSNPSPSKTLLKPIIIVDGFDPGDKRKIEDCDCADDADCNAKNQTAGVYDTKKHDSFVDLMDYYEGANKKSLIIKLRGLGYDVILVNQPNYSAVNEINGQSINVDGGADYIERNALALVSLFKQVNSKLLQNGSASNMAVFGPSMGGQISRYALAYMEKKYAETGDVSWKHNTYLWVSVDSPHLGANIPMGVQSLLNLLKDDSDGAKEFYEKSLASPAAQQQLIEYHKEKPVVINVFGIPFNTTDYNNADPNNLNSQTISQNMPTNRGNTMFQQHYINDSNNGVENSKGWPINLRKIAMTNGSLSGSKETLLPSGASGPTFAADGEKVLNLRGFQRVNIELLIGSITWRTHIASLESIFMPTVGNNSRISRFKKLFNDRTTNAPNFNARGIMDNVPGGFYNAQALIYNDATATDPVSGINLNEIENWSLVNLSINNIVKSISERLGGSEWYLHEYNPIHSFVPTFSALAITNPNQNWNNPLNTNLICPSNKQTPFDSYYGENKNTEHTSFTYESVKWLLEELKNNPQAPHFPIQAGTLLGNDSVCEGANTTYTIADFCKVPSPVKYNDQNGNAINGWSVQGNLSIVSSTPYSVTVQGNSNSGNSGKIIATFQNGQIFEKEVWVGKPKFPVTGIVDGVSNTIYNQTLTYTYSGAFPSGATSTYQWYVSAPSNQELPLLTNAWQILSGQGTNSITVRTGSFETMAVVAVKVTNSCGADEKYMYVKIAAGGTNTGGDPCIPTLKIFPNPVKGNSFQLKVLPPAEPCDPNLKSIKNTVKMYDFYGNLVYDNAFVTNDIQIDNLNLKSGNYVLNVITDIGESIREIIIIE